MSRALEQAIASGEGATGAVIETWDTDTRDDSVSPDRSFVLASQTTNGVLRGILLRRAKDLPKTETGWSALTKLFGEERDEELHQLLDFVAVKLGRPDLQPPPLTDAGLDAKLASLVRFWKGKRLVEVRSPAFLKNAAKTP